MSVGAGRIVFLSQCQLEMNVRKVCAMNRSIFFALALGLSLFSSYLGHVAVKASDERWLHLLRLSIAMQCFRHVPQEDSWRVFIGYIALGALHKYHDTTAFTQRPETLKGPGEIALHPCLALSIEPYKTKKLYISFSRLDDLRKKVV